MSNAALPIQANSLARAALHPGDRHEAQVDISEAIHLQRTNAAPYGQPSGSSLGAAAIVFFKNRGVHEKSVSRERSRWLRANAKQFAADLEEFRRELACRFNVKANRGLEYWQKNAIKAAGEELARRVDQHCSRVVIHDPKPILVCLDSLPEVMFAELGNWAELLMTARRMQFLAQGPGGRPADESQVVGKLLKAAQGFRNEPMVPGLPIQAFFVLCDELGVLPPEVCSVVCRDIHHSVERLLHTESAGSVADCAESLVEVVTRQLENRPR